MSFKWSDIRDALDDRGFAMVPNVMDVSTCDALAALYDLPEQFRSRVVMKRHGFGSGEYQYFADPLPPPIQRLRQDFYPELAPLANIWAERMGTGITYPADHATYRAVCEQAGQSKPTPLLLKYRQGDFNRLHQDLYGDLYFPIQMVVLLTAPEAFTGGQFMLTETRPRIQTRAEVVSPGQGDAVLFAVNQRPVTSARGYSRVTMRHGVSTITSGNRMTLGVIFHDAR